MKKLSARFRSPSLPRGPSSVLAGPHDMELFVYLSTYIYIYMHAYICIYICVHMNRLLKRHQPTTQTSLEGSRLDHLHNRNPMGSMPEDW